MKRINFWLLLLGISGVALVSSCKSDEINPIDMLLGYYTDGGTEDVYLEKKEGNKALVKINLYQQGALPDGTYGYRFKVYPFPNCEIAIIDTTIKITSNNGNQNQFYAKIINKDNNTILGEITKWDSYQTATKRSYFGLVTNNRFNIKDTLVKNKVFLKWIN
jgi:hypothetical protein